MATLTYDRFLCASAQPEIAAAGQYPAPAGARQIPFATRDIPFEDVWFVRKRLDNSRCVRRQDPQERRICWSSLAGAISIVLLVISLLVPGAFVLVDGYTVQALKQEHQKLLRQRAVLELEELRRLSPKRLEELARLQQFIDPGPDQLVYLDKGETVALNNAVPKQ